MMHWRQSPSSFCQLWIQMIKSGTALCLSARFPFYALFTGSLEIAMFTQQVPARNSRNLEVFCSTEKGFCVLQLSKFQSFEQVEREILLHCFVQTFHESVRVYSLKFKEQLGRFNYLTPTSFLELISSFQVNKIKSDDFSIRSKS